MTNTINISLQNLTEFEIDVKEKDFAQATHYEDKENSPLVMALKRTLSVTDVKIVNSALVKINDVMFGYNPFKWGVKPGQTVNEKQKGIEPEYLSVEKINEYIAQAKDNQYITVGKYTIPTIKLSLRKC